MGGVRRRCTTSWRETGWDVKETLSSRLEQVVARTKGVFAFYVHDLATGAKAELRAGEPFPAASVIKLPIMLRLLEMAQDGAVSLDQTVTLTDWHKTGGSGVLQYFRAGLAISLEDACTAMIALSDNTATNLILDVTGIEPVNAMLDRLGCRHTRLHRYFGKPEMPGPPGPSLAVPVEIGRLYELLLHGSVLSPPLSALAVAILRRQMWRAAIPRYLPEGTPIAHKTGSLNGVRHDAGIIWRPAPVAGARPESAGPSQQGPRRPPASGRAPAGCSAQGTEAPPRPATGTMDLRGRAAGETGSWPRPPGCPIVFVGMSRDVADQRWTVENQAEKALARAAKVAFDYLMRNT